MHGTADNVFAMEDAEALADRWRRVNACAAAPLSEPIGANAVAVRSTGCAGGTSVELVRIEGQPHRWFHEPDATELAWRFFAEATVP
jgi:poly(3-hydroxybutyrate) depolymerase